MRVTRCRLASSAALRRCSSVMSTRLTSTVPGGSSGAAKASVTSSAAVLPSVRRRDRWWLWPRAPASSASIWSTNGALLSDRSKTCASVVKASAGAGSSNSARAAGFMRNTRLACRQAATSAG